MDLNIHGSGPVQLKEYHRMIFKRIGSVVNVAYGSFDFPESKVQTLNQTGFDATSAETIVHVPRVLFVPLCRLMARHGTTRPGAWLERWLLRCEALGRLPTREITGHFVAVVARRRP